MALENRRWGSPDRRQRSGGAAAARDVRASPSRQLAAVGLVAVLLHVAVVSTALLGLDEVEQAHAAVADITTAQRRFQDADMRHDEIRAEAILALARAEGAAWAGSGAQGVEELERAVSDYRAQLRGVDAVGLPPDLETAVSSVRPVQVRYAAQAERLGAVVVDDQAAARALLQDVQRTFETLVVEQAVVTAAMSDEAGSRREAARRHEQSVFWRLVLSALAALLGLLGLTGLLRRLGGNLATLLARERSVAETLQHSLLPDRLPNLPGVRFAARYLPGQVGTQVGGDWYDVITLPGGKVGLVMGDVVGHDIQAAAYMGQLRNALRACAAEGASPDVVLQRMNRLCLQQDLGSMATVLYAVLDPVDSTLEIANAGHYPPLLLTTGECRYLEALPAPPIGAVWSATYTTSTYEISAGSLLLLYTDGLVERPGEMVDVGLERLQGVVPWSPEGDLDTFCDDLLRRMLAGASRVDDVAVLSVAPQPVLGARIDVLWPAEAGQLVLLRHMLERWLVEAGASDDETYDIVVACSEAATNAIEHAYGPGRADFRVACDLRDGLVTIVVRDWGQWREARGQDRGRGLGLMEGLMDEAEVTRGDQGTEVRLRRRLRAPSAAPTEPLAVGG